MALSRRRYKLASLYGLTEETYGVLLAEQGGKCYICQCLPESVNRLFAVDHDHRCCPGIKTCGTCIRGLLCSPCNLKMRALDEWSVEEFARAEVYRDRRPIPSV